jgi:ribosomal-protein-serine acetyltransferase
MVRWDIGDHIEMRPFEEYHAEEIFCAVERNREHLRRWLPWVDRTRGVEDVQNFLADVIEAYGRGEEMHNGIFIHGKLAGTCSHHHIDPMSRNVSIGYWLDATVEGKGVMTRCCGALVRHLFEERRMHRVEIRCATGNTRSCAIPERLGFTREAVLREAEWVNDRFVDLVIWSLLEQDYFLYGGPPGRRPTSTSA